MGNESPLCFAPVKSQCKPLTRMPSLQSTAEAIARMQVTAILFSPDTPYSNPFFNFENERGDVQMNST